MFRNLAALSALAALLGTVTLAGCRGGHADGTPTMAPRTLDLAAAGGQARLALCYGPHRDGQRPGGTEPTADQLREDLALLAPHTGLLRTYGAGGSTETLLQEIRAGGFPVRLVLGAWIAPDDPRGNAAETATAIRLANAYPDIVAAVSVGNETQVSWSAHRCPVDTLLAQVRRVRTAVKAPVTVADDFNFWNKPDSRRVAAEIDFITMHAHPLWNGRRLDEALPWLQGRLDEVRALHPDRPVLVGETGWATSYHDAGEQGELIKGAVGEAEQRVYYDAVRAWAGSERLPVFFFEAFDENWKGGDHPDEVEKHWGLFRADRSPKAAVAVRD